jgi:hypothetical protein
MLTFMLLDGAKNVLDSSIDIEGLRFARVGDLDTWSVWVQCEKLCCLASIDLTDCDTYAWWDIAAEVRKELLEYEYCAGDRSGLWCVEKPLYQLGGD